MAHAKKCISSLCLSLLVASPFIGHAQTMMQADSTRAMRADSTQSYKPNYWTVGAKLFSPLLFNNLSSLPGGREAHLGYGGGLSLGYQFSPLFALDLNVGYGRTQASASPYQDNFQLGRLDAFTYYPYTLIDGDEYQYPYRSNEGELLIGYRGKRLDKEADGFRFENLESRVALWQASLNASINLNRLFYTHRYTEKPVELWLRPGVYLSGIQAKLVDKQSGDEVAPAVNQDLTLGLGGDVALRFNIHHAWAIELSNSIIWQHNRSIDGIASAKMGYDAFLWEPAVGLVYKFGRKAKPVSIPPAPTPLPEPIPAVKITRPSSISLDYAPQKTVDLPVKKERSHTLAIHLTYPLNKTMIVPHLHHNATELARINQDIADLKTHSDYKVTGIRIEGFASPEGPYDNNMRLAEGRARAIMEYVIGKTGWSRSLFALGRMEENWQGLRDTLTADPSLPAQAEALRLLDTESNKEVVKQELKKLKGYPELLAKAYPYLRLSSYTVDYELPVYPLQKAKELIYKDPKSLNPEEIYAVALDFGLESMQGQEALNILMKLYPEHTLSRCYKAIKALDAQRPQEVLSALEVRSQKTDHERELLAVAYARLGRFDDAFQQLIKVQHPTDLTRNNIKRLSEYINK